MALKRTSPTLTRSSHGLPFRNPVLHPQNYRAKSYGVERIMVTAGTLSEVQTALKLIEINGVLSFSFQ